MGGAVCGTVGPLWSPLPRTETPGPTAGRSFQSWDYKLQYKRPLDVVLCILFTIQRRKRGQIAQWVMGELDFPTPTPVLFLL